MKLILTYKSCNGTATLCGEPNAPFRITHISGLGLPDREYITASYAGYDGQETLSCSALPRTITVSGDIMASALRDSLTKLLDVVTAPGYLYICRGNLNRRIYCNQITIPDIQQILYGRICTFTAQFVCDSPFFEDVSDISAPLYKRTKELCTPFTLPCMFGKTVSEADIPVESPNSVEPVIRILFPSALEDATSVTLTNHTNKGRIEFPYTPEAGEEIIIDIKNRTAVSSAKGSILGILSDDTFLGDFVLLPKLNHLSAVVGNINAGIFIECVYNNRYNEAMVI